MENILGEKRNGSDALSGKMLLARIDEKKIDEHFRAC